MFKKSLTEKSVRSALEAVIDPKSGKNVIQAGLITDILIQDAHITLTMEIEPKSASIMDGVRARCDAAIALLPGVESVRTVMTAHSTSTAVPPKTSAPPPKAPGFGHGRKSPPQPKPIPGIEHIIVIASGKGGVGKSTTAINIASAMAAKNLSVGVLDIDIFGPSVQRMLGDGDDAKMGKDKTISPVTRHGIKAMSMGYLVPEGRSTVWRGPMVIGAVQQLINGVTWTEDGPLDCLIVDLPPGTGDAQLTLVQTVPLSGAIIVSTPQDIALIDARKAYDMFQKTNTPVLGLIENMSTFICPNCDHETHIFGHGGARNTAAKQDIPFLGEIPLHLEIRTHADDGIPIVVAKPDGQQARAYHDIADKIMDSVR